MTCISRLSSSIIPVKANKHKCNLLLLSAMNMIHQKESYPAAQKSLCHSPTQWHDQNSRSRKFEIIKPTLGERKVYQAAQKSLKVSQHQTAPPRKFTRQLKKVWSPPASGWSLCSQSSPPRQTLAPANNSTQWKWKRWVVKSGNISKWQIATRIDQDSGHFVYEFQNGHLVEVWDHWMLLPILYICPLYVTPTMCIVT